MEVIYISWGQQGSCMAQELEVGTAHRGSQRHDIGVHLFLTLWPMIKTWARPMTQYNEHYK